MHLVSTTSTLEDNLYSIDWLKVALNIDHDSHSLNDGIRVDFRRVEDGYDEENKMISFKPLYVKGSHNSHLTIKSQANGLLQIEGNFYKWLNGQNITGSTDLIGLVISVVKQLAQDRPQDINPSPEQLKEIESGDFKVNMVDINKPILLDDKDQALKYLERLKLYSSYPYRRDKTIYGNGIYFNENSKRSVLKYYFKGNEIKVNCKNQTKLTPELVDLADRMIRCELRIKWTQLQDWGLLQGSDWSDDKVKHLIDDTHSKLRLPTANDYDHLPTKYVRFIACYKQGVLDCYSDTTIKRMKSDLIRKFGYYLDQQAA